MSEMIGRSSITLYPNGKGGCTVEEVHIRLELSNDLDKRMYFSKIDDTGGIPNREGCRCLTQTFLQGLNANIQSAHIRGLWDSAEHLRYIIAELENAFIQPVDISDEIE
jgi:hypothetical protein